MEAKDLVMFWRFSPWDSVSFSDVFNNKLFNITFLIISKDKTIFIDFTSNVIMIGINRIIFNYKGLITLVDLNYEGT